MAAASGDGTSDLLVIGAGPGGYVAAIRASQLGMRVTLVEKRDAPGGTCLNIGCIPSKTLLHASEQYAALASGELSDFGIGAKGVSLDVAKLMAEKNKIIKGLTDGINYLLKKNRINYIRGQARLISANEVAVAGGSGSAKSADQRIKTKRILIASGSQSQPLTGVAVDEKNIVTSTGALSLSKVPKSMAVIGGGYIGLEMACVWQRLGARVEVVEFQPRILPGMDSEIASKFQKILEAQGIKFRLSTSVSQARLDKKSGVVLNVTAAGKSADKPSQIKADVALLAIGRRPYTENLGLDAVGVACDEGGRIKVNAKFETSVAGIYAIGDVIAGPMLAHKAEEDGVAAVECMAGKAGHVDYGLVAGIVYTNPEVAVIGKSEDDLKAEGVAYNKGAFPFTANSRARAIAHSEGFVKILAHAKTDRVLGVHIIGADAGGLIHECATAMAFAASAEDIARICHAHPTLNEAVKEAALAVDKRAIHI